jgi:hypothetical protein
LKGFLSGSLQKSAWLVDAFFRSAAPLEQNFTYVLQIESPPIPLWAWDIKGIIIATTSITDIAKSFLLFIYAPIFIC